MKTISVVTPCFNEEGNVREVYERVRDLMSSLGRYRYEHIFIDNASRDATFAVLSELAAADANVKVIRNARNFGHVRSPMHALLQTCGDAVIILMSDLQDPPEVLAQLLEQWEKGIPAQGYVDEFLREIDISIVIDSDFSDHVARSARSDHFGPQSNPWKLA